MLIFALAATSLVGVPVLVELIESSLHLGRRTKELYAECVAEFVKTAGDDPRTYTSAIVEDWLHSLLKERKPQTVNVYRKAIRYASRRWARRGGDHVDFAAIVDKVKEQARVPRDPLTYDEAQKLLATCDTDELADVRDRALIILALRSGLRRGGLRALEFSGIRPPKITTINKGGDFITFEADDETLGALAAWLARLRERGVSAGQVFRVVRGQEIRSTMSAFQIWRVFDARAKEAGIRHVFPHLARHSTVTWLREEGKSSAEVSKLTGQTERTIENIYTHVRTRGAVGAALPSLLKSRKP